MNPYLFEGLKNAKSAGEESSWNYPRNYTVTCLQVGRSEDTFYESAIGEDFRAGMPVLANCPALLFVPGKCLVALTIVEG